MTAYIIFHAYCICHNLGFIRYCAKQDPKIFYDMLAITENVFIVSIRAVFFVMVLAPFTFLALARCSQDSIKFILDFIFKEKK